MCLAKCPGVECFRNGLSLPQIGPAEDPANLSHFVCGFWHTGVCVSLTPHVHRHAVLLGRSHCWHLSRAIYCT